MSDILIKELPLDRSAADIFALFKDEPFACLLESSQKQGLRGRYSFIVFDPFDVVSLRGPGALAAVKERFDKYPFIAKPALTPFAAGIVGFLSYDYGLHQERVAEKQKPGLHMPDCCFGFFDRVITIDHVLERMIITSTGLPARAGAPGRAAERLAYVTDRLEQGTARSFLTSQLERVSFESVCSKEQYLQSVREALKHIYDGDIYQVNLSRQFQVKTQGTYDPFELYRALREISPSCFSAYVQTDEFQIISSSPERFLCLDGKHVQTSPMKGTRPRGNSPEEDTRMRTEMLMSAKDRAELLMITDLARNDLGKCCAYGSVRVKDMRSVETYRTVFQTTSTVEGILKEGCDAFDVLSACFPGGSITGCPKIRSMQIIEDLEPVRRGVYTGILGYMSFHKTMDFNILIRTLVAARDNLCFHVGGGIVADSTPEGEYEETLVKARAIHAALASLTRTIQLSPHYSA